MKLADIRDVRSFKEIGRVYEDYLSYAIIDENDSKKYVCRYCNMSFTEEDAIRHHVQTAHPNQKKISIFKFHNTSYFKIHSEEKKENYMCDVCNQQFATEISVRNHITRCHKLRKCPFCDLKFSRVDLRNHQLEAHDMLLPTCGICGYKSWNQTKVTMHQRRVHMNEKNTSCDECGMKFFGRLNLRRHQIAHGTDRKYECSYCHKKYPRLNTLRIHEKIHTKIKEKKCAECGAAFVQKASLNYHMKKHHPEAV